MSVQGARGPTSDRSYDGTIRLGEHSHTHQPSQKPIQLQSEPDPEFERLLVGLIKATASVKVIRGRILVLSGISLIRRNIYTAREKVFRRQQRDKIKPAEEREQPQPQP